MARAEYRRPISRYGPAMLPFVRILLLAPLLVWTLPATAENPGLPLRVAAADPAGGGRLAGRDPLYLKISYSSAVPLRFQAKGYAGGIEVVEGAMYNPAPVYPAGAHEALVWLAYAEPAHIDEVRIFAFDAGWKPVRMLSYPVALEWTPSGPPRHARASWVAQMNEWQQTASTEAAARYAESDDSGWIFIALPAAVLGYLVLQIVMLLGFSGGWRTAAALPLIGTVPLLLYTVAAFAMGSNLWPLMMLFLTPPALLYLLGLLLLRLVARALAPS